MDGMSIPHTGYISKTQPTQLFVNQPSFKKVISPR
jgi:hypothetical protein